MSWFRKEIEEGVCEGIRGALPQAIGKALREPIRDALRDVRDMVLRRLVENRVTVMVVDGKRYRFTVELMRDQPE